MTSHDVNAVSVIIQQKLAGKVPVQFLRDTAQTSGLSADTMKIVDILLADDYAPNKRTPHNKIAKHYYEWALNK